VVNRKYFFAGLLACCSAVLEAQTDTLKTITIPNVTVEATRNVSLESMPETDGIGIFAAKKSAVIRPDRLDADLANVNQRQLFGKVAGISIWENDGTGLQIGVASRGLSPNRSWEFNVRQNGYDISADVFGYPEAYFAPPMEAVARIEIVRGAASLQYGAQFGGLLNYVIKKGDPVHALNVEMRQTVGSFGLMNTFLGLGGTRGKWSYYGYFHQRAADGWRQNSRYRTTTGFGSLTYRVSERLTISADLTLAGNEQQQAGGLTQQQFEQDPRQSSRSRNWFSTPWNVANVHLSWKPSATWSVDWKTFGILAERNSVGFTSAINIAEAADTLSGLFSPRQVDRDLYANYGAELRTMKTFTWQGRPQQIAAGVRGSRAHTNRLQRGVGSTGSFYDLTISSVGWGRDMDFYALNGAAFVEVALRPIEHLVLTPGARFEWLQNIAKGYYTSGTAGALDDTRSRTIPLLGIGAEYHIGKTEVYANFSQAYRPVLFSDLTPSGTAMIVDPNLRDASGYNADLGYRGKVKDYLTFDVSAFLLNYNNRIGEYSVNGNPFRTNIGRSLSRGAEIYAELNTQPWIGKKGCGYFNVFSAVTLMNATYERWYDPATFSDASKSRVGKKVENAPDQMVRAGITWRCGGFSATGQYNYVSSVFADALNTVESNATATNGLIPSYGVTDVSFSWQLREGFALAGGVNNITDENYFTRRAGGYPGPGILPGIGRNYFLSFIVKFAK
jgi:Fe(3+) dicitrate transport protein